jgi:hypothetical protein
MDRPQAVQSHESQCHAKLGSGGMTTRRHILEDSMLPRRGGGVGMDQKQFGRMRDGSAIPHPAGKGVSVRYLNLCMKVTP